MTDLPDMNDLLRQAMAMQEQLLAAQQEAAERTVTGTAGGGLVRVTHDRRRGAERGRTSPPTPSTPPTPSCSRTWCWRPCATPLHQVQQLQASAMGGLDLGALGLGGLGDADPGDPGELGGPGQPGALGPGSG